MAGSFLGRLLSYSPRPNRTAAEDFCTEALAGVLEADARLLPAILRLGEERKRIQTGWVLNAEEPYEVRTQYEIGAGCRPDLVVLVGGQPTVVIEAKLGADFTWGSAEVPPPPGSPASDATNRGGSQLSRYVRAIKTSKWDTTVVLLTLDFQGLPEACDPAVYLGNLLWSDVHDALCRAPASRDARARVLCKELIKFMEERHMIAHTPLRFGDAATHYRNVELRAKMSSLLDRIGTSIADRYAVVLKPPRGAGRPPEGYEYRTLLTLDNLELNIGVVVGARDELNQAMWLFLHVSENSSAGPWYAAAFSALEAEVSGLPAFPGRIVYPEYEQLARFLGAWDWEAQVHEGVVMVREWFDKLVAAGVVTAHQDRPDAAPEQDPAPRRDVP